jgi:galactose mutarotase-like enzyme
MDSIILQSRDLSARFALRGAELGSLTYREREQIWSGDPQWWDYQAPILFPVVGRSPGDQVSVNGRAYHMPLHGFARDRAFKVLQVTGSSAVLEQQADYETRSMYPFEYRLEVHLGVEGNALSMTTLIENRDKEPMPISFGYHPGFLWPTEPEARARYLCRFEQPETGRLRRAKLGVGLLLPERVKPPFEGRTLHLTDDLFSTGALQFESVRSHWVWFGAAGGEGLLVAFPDSPQLGVWTRPGAPFLCIEPWQGLAAELDGSPELADRPGARILKSGEEAHYRLSLAFGVEDPGLQGRAHTDS